MSNFLRSFITVAVLTAGALAYAGDIYYCPMHPYYTSDKPGNCPICGMTLVKKEGHPSAEHALQEHLQGGDHAQVVLNPQQTQVLGVQTVPALRQTLVKTVKVPGYVSTYHELYQVQDAYIRAYFAYVTIYRDYRRFQHTRRNWETHRELQTKLHEAEDKLLRLGLSPDQIKKLQNISWKTPWDQPGLILFKEEVHYWVIAQVFERDLGYVEAGQEVEIDISSYAEKAKGTVMSVGAVLDPATRTVNALIEINDYRGELAGNMFASVTVRSELGESLVVPIAAVTDTGTRKIVYVQTKPGTFEPRQVEMGALGDNGWAVKSGLKEGEQVAVEGNFLLDSESRLQAAAGGTHP